MRISRPVAPLLGFGLVLALFGACADNNDGVGFRETPSDGAGVGESCGSSPDCRRGLSCDAGGTCQPTGDAVQDASCQISLECAPGLHCDARVATCQPAGETGQGQACSDIGQCERGLACLPQGFSGLCSAAGAADSNRACQTSADCLAGLNCAGTGTDRKCIAGPLGLPRPFTGAQCVGDGVHTDGALRGYFEVPNEDLVDFYRLPFPNDIRLVAGRPNLSGHPTPGSELLGFDLVQRYIDAIEAEQDHWGLNQAVFFRFSGRLDYDKSSLDSGGDDPSIYLVDITPGSAEYNERQPIYWQASTARTPYICHNWISVRPTWGRPLNPRTTYAAVVTSHVRGAEGEAVEQDTQFAAMLGATRPDGPVGTAWDAYQPLRTWLAEQGLAPSALAVAAVFTTGDPREITKGLRTAARTSPPSLSDLTTCADGVTSPCEDGLTGEEHLRGCFGESDAFTEIQGKVSLPVFQRGVPPFLGEGGGLEFINGLPAIQRNEDVCMAMTVPKATMPEAGWPVLIYAHGTGGSYRSHVGNVASQVGTFEHEGQTMHMLTIGWDQVQHFTRRGDSDLDPEALVYNFANPHVAQGNFWQAAVDIHSIVQLVETLDMEIDGQRVKADPSQIWFLGHSQGGTSGPLALPYEPGIKGAILSGAGGGLTLSLLGKTSPVNIPDGLAVALQDPTVTESHPVLNLLQGYFDTVDPVNYAELIGARQIEGQTYPHHVFHTFGIGDTYTPKLTLETMATALRLTMADPLVEPLERGFAPTAPLPIRANGSVGGQPTTLIGRQYQPDGYDGHFVLFRHPAAQDDMLEFLGSGLTGNVPEIKD